MRFYDVHTGDGAETTLEARYTLFKRSNRGVRNARVDVAVLLQSEAGCGVFGVVEDKRTALVNGKRTCATHLIGNVACVDGAGLEPVFAICHAFQRTYSVAVPNGWSSRTVTLAKDWV